MLMFNFEFLGWTVGLLATLAALAYVFVFWITHWAIVLLVAAAVTIYILKWARIFLVRMIVDYDANNGDGRVIIERLLPHPPCRKQFSSRCSKPRKVHPKSTPAA